jgi:hypothetical protein
MSSDPLIVRLDQGRAEVCNGRRTFCVSGRNTTDFGYGCPTDLIGAALGS